MKTTYVNTKNSNISSNTAPASINISDMFFKSYSELKVSKVIYNNPATIVYFSDGSKSVVKLHPEDTFNETTGLLMAISKRLLGSKNLHRALKDFTKNYD